MTDIGAAEQRDGSLWLSVAEAGVDAVAVLVAALGAAVSGLSFIKVMCWNNSGASLSRPVRLLLALLSAEVVAVRHAGVAADRLVYGLRDGCSCMLGAGHGAVFLRAVGARRGVSLLRAVGAGREVCFGEQGDQQVLLGRPRHWMIAAQWAVVDA